MINFTTWLQDHSSKKPWLIAGKGPSFEKLNQHDSNDYQIITLNHAIQHISALIAHVIDFDVITDAQSAIDKNAQYLLMPWHPHIDNKSGAKNLKQIALENDFIKQLDDQNRLLWYNSSHAQDHHPDFPVVEVKYFSADAVVSLLAANAVNNIYTVGIDGGKTYNHQFEHLNDKTLLSNSRASFNDQFIAIAQIQEQYPVSVNPLGEPSIKVYSGSMQDQWLASRVLEFSIRWRTSACVEFFPLYDADINIPKPKDPSNQPRTPFSFQRFLIPALNQYQGRGIYLDSDMLVFTDIRDLAFRDMKSQDVLNVWDTSGEARRPQFSVMLMNCEALDWDIKKIVQQLDSGELSYEQLMYEMKVAKNIAGELENEWNSLEHYEADKTKLLHYTDMNRQPWLTRNNPNADLWLKELATARALGYISKDEVKQQVVLGHVRPSIVYQLKTQRYNPQDIPGWVKWIDKLFKPPHKQKGLFWTNSAVKYLLGNISFQLAKLLARFN